MNTKRECKECLLVEEEESKNLSNLVGKEVLDDILLGLFNPDSLESKGENESDNEEMIEKYLNERSTSTSSDYLQERFEDMDYNWFHRTLQYADRETAKEEVWDKMLDMVREGEMEPRDLPLRQMLRNIPRKILERLAKEGYLDLKWQRHLINSNVYLGHVEFTAESERLITKRILDEAFRNLEKLGYGLHELRKPGSGTNPSDLISEFDEYQHSYDNLDLQETMLTAAIKDPEKMNLEADMFKARIPLHKSGSSNIILMDISGSMYGNKFKGCIMAALSLRQLLEEEFKDDTLYVIAYNDEPKIVQAGEVLKLRPHGQTDIGRALDLCTQILSKDDGNRNIFMITDSEPTVSYFREFSPVENMYRAALATMSEKIRLHVIMLDRDPGLRSISENMAKLNGYSNVAYVDNPLNLKEFVIRTFIDSKRIVEA